MRTLHIILLSALFLLFSRPAFSQGEFSIYAAGGISSMYHKPEAGKVRNGFGGHFGMGYRYFITRQWGVGTGLEWANRLSTVSIDYFSCTYPATDADGDSFDFRTEIRDYEEEDNGTFLNIPVMVHCRMVSRHIFRFSAGGKIAIPLKGKYHIKRAAMENSGYYADEDYEYTTQAFMGFGTFEKEGIKGEMELKTGVLLSAEAGMEWGVGNGVSLYAGIAVDYGLNDVSAPVPGKEFVTYNAANPADPTINSMMASGYESGGGYTEMAGKVLPFI